MKKYSEVSADEGFFTIGIKDAIAVIRFTECPISRGTNLYAKELFLYQFQKVSDDKAIKVIVIVSPSQHDSFESVSNIYKNHSDSILDDYYVKRLHNAADQYAQKIVNCNKITLFVDKSTESSYLLNIGLACDYRIAAEGVILSNPYFKNGMIPKGGVIHFLKRALGYNKTFRFFFSNETITQETALELGLIDEVAHKEMIDTVAIERAREFAVKPAHYIYGIKKLLNRSEKALEASLELEDRIISYCSHCAS